MFDKAVNATENFFRDILSLDIKRCKNTKAKDLFCSQINFFKADRKLTFNFYFKKETLKNISEIFLFERELDEKSMKDLTNEIANLIIGSAKVLAEDEDEKSRFKISTPKFMGIAKASDIDFANAQLFKIKNRCFIIEMKEKN